MDNIVEDLWPDDLINTNLRPPLKILNEQATALRGKSKDLVVGIVDEVSGSSGSTRYTFTLVAPRLNDYSYKLFTIEHNFAFYPCVFVDYSTQGQSMYDGQLSSEGTLVNHLRTYFRDPNVIGIVQTLIARSVHT